MDHPQSTAAWVLSGQNGIESLEFLEKLSLPPIKDNDILVKIHAVSLNARELGVARGARGLQLGHKDLVPGSDGAGVVEAVGPKVTNFRVGDRVCTHLTCGLSEEEFPTFPDICAGLGQTVDGTLRQYGVFHETSLVKMPSNLSFLEAATLTCSGLTAWNALFGLESKVPKPGATVIVQGTGGVSIAALQFSLAAGATVIATTSSEEKADKLRSIGAHHVVNYRETPNWGEVVKSLTRDGKGADIIVDVGGESTLEQSLKAVCVNGLVAATGILGDAAPGAKIPTVLDCVFACCTARGILLGSRKQFNEMNRFIEQHNIKPILDQRQFDLASVKEAYTFQKEQKHFSKIGIQIASNF